MHDIVITSLRTLQLPVGTYSNAFERSMDEYAEEIAFEESSDLAFLSFCQIHKEQLERLLHAHPDTNGYLYCLLHTWHDQECDLSLIGDLDARARTAVASKYPSDIGVMTVLEAIEAIYRKRKYDDGIPEARASLERCLPLYDLLASAAGISDAMKFHILHHRAKALRNLQRYPEAISLCEQILAARYIPATKLLLARLFLFDEATRERAKCLLFDLLRESQTAPDRAEISVTLAAITALGQWQLKTWFREALNEFGDLVADLIVQAAARGLDQAYVAFAAIGRETQFNNEELFFRVFNGLPLRLLEDVQDDKERAAWGDILLAAGKAAPPNDASDLLNQALRFYEALDNPVSYNLQQKGQTLLLLGRNGEAVGVLEPLVSATPNPWNQYWLSKALASQGQLPKSFELINKALNDPKAIEYRPAFLEHRFDVRKAQGESGAIDDLLAAHELCNNEKYKAALARKLDENRPLQE